VTLARVEELLKPLSKPFKRQGDPYARSTMLSSQQSEAAAAVVAAAVAGEGELYTALT
jgi:hypothetical protein